MVVYDRNRDQQLDVNEIELASVRFMPFFKRVRKIENEYILKQGFKFMLVNGRIPTNAEFASFAAGQAWDSLWGNDLVITRFQIFRVFDGIKDFLSKVH